MNSYSFQSLSGVNKNHPLSEGFKPLAAASQKQVIYQGKGISFTPRDKQPDVAKVSSFLFSRFTSFCTPKKLFTLKNIKNICYRTDASYLRAFQGELQYALVNAFKQFHAGDVNKKLFELYVHHILALIPFSYPTEGFSLRIPVEDKTGWRLVNYTLDKEFKLTKSWFRSPLPAYGFIAEDSPPILAFIGTTYPAGKGFLAGLFSDFTPGLSVGSMPMRLGKEALGKWLAGKSNVRVCGASLGGALSLHAAKEFKEHIANVYAFEPPGFYPWDLRDFDVPNIQLNLCFQEGDDIVPNVGFFPEGENVSLYHLSENKNRSLTAHARVFASAENVTLSEVSLEHENQRFFRKFSTVGHFIVSFLVVSFLLPIQSINLFVTLFSKIYQIINNRMLGRVFQDKIYFT